MYISVANKRMLLVIQNHTKEKGMRMMKEPTGSIQQTVFMIIFWILAILTWCPIGYGGYGAVSRIFAMPSWAAIALMIGAALFVVEWIYLFHTDMALTDEKLTTMLKALENYDAAKEGRS